MYGVAIMEVELLAIAVYVGCVGRVGSVGRVQF